MFPPLSDCELNQVTLKCQLTIKTALKFKFEGEKFMLVRS